MVVRVEGPCRRKEPTVQVRKNKRKIMQRILAVAVERYDYCRTRTQALRHFFTLRLTARELGRAQAAKRCMIYANRAEMDADFKPTADQNAAATAFFQQP